MKRIRKPHVIFTMSDAHCGDFLADHWLCSLQHNVNLDHIEVVILDYGLTEEQRARMKKVTIIRCTNDGFPSTLRFRDMATYLRAHSHDQVMTCDAGDIIFQADISTLFKEHKDQYRAVCESVPNGFFDQFFTEGYFDPADIEKIRREIKGKPMINAGVILAPSDLFIQLCDTCLSMIKKRPFGPDQIAVNYVLYKQGFINLPSHYNFIPATAGIPYKVIVGKIYLDNGTLVPIVHNAGRYQMLRVIEHFGYGAEFNSVNPVKQALGRVYQKIVGT
jgi:hypothetical protein